MKIQADFRIPDAMDNKLLNFVSAALFAVGGWYMTGLNTEIAQLRQRAASTEVKVAEIRADVASDYVRRTDYRADVAALNAKLDSIIERLGTKADRK